MAKVTADDERETVALSQEYDREGLFILSGFTVGKQPSAASKRVFDAFLKASSVHGEAKLMQMAITEARRRVAKELEVFGNKINEETPGDAMFHHLEYAMAAILDELEKGNIFPTPEDLGRVPTASGRQL